MYFCPLPYPTEQFQDPLYSCACLAEHCIACMFFVMFVLGFWSSPPFGYKKRKKEKENQKERRKKNLGESVQSVFCIYKLEHLFYETVMQFYY